LLKLLTIGLLLICSCGVGIAQDAAPPTAAATVKTARLSAQTSISQQRAELHGLRAELKAGTISKEAARELILQIRAAIQAARRG
jgi:hypothetical protein